MENPPSKEKADILYAVGKGFLAMIPYAGSPLQSLMEVVIAPPLERRREKWLSSLAEVVSSIEEKTGGLSPEELSKNEMFITAAVQATQVALRTHQEEKLQALKAAVLNSALPGAPQEDQQLMFLHFIDELTPWHLRVLALFNAPKVWVKDNYIQIPSWMGGAPSTLLEYCFPEIRKPAEFYNQIFRDLQVRGLLAQGQYLNATMTVEGMFQSRTTELGRSFLSFISGKRD
jgi:hypothetical protein